MRVCFSKSKVPSGDLGFRLGSAISRRSHKVVPDLVGWTAASLGARGGCFRSSMSVRHHAGYSFL